jgi:hypothetical protein
MSDILRAKWTILVEKPPQPLLHCSRCNGTASFRANDRFRVNANGRCIDAWLIYRCTSCDSTWNRPILERRRLRSIDPLFLAALQANDRALARRVALNVEDLRRRVGEVEQFDTAVVVKEVQSSSTVPARQVEILFAVPYPIACRLDRLLAVELQLARSHVQAMEKSGALVIVPGGPRAMRSPVRDGMRVTIVIAAGHGHPSAQFGELPSVSLAKVRGTPTA